MEDPKSIALRFGRYRTPEFEYGDLVMDEVRGEVTIVELSDSPILWPIGKRGRIKALVLYADLIRAVQKEAG